MNPLPAYWNAPRRFQTHVWALFVFLTILPAAPAAGQQALDRFAKEMGARWQVRRAEAELLARRKHLPLRVRWGDTASAELQRFEGLFPRYYATTNLNAAISLSTDKVWPGAGYGLALTGATDTVGEWDEGAVRTTHQEFQGRVVATEGSLSIHSTHVAGTLIAGGVVHAARGMSYEGHLRSFDWNNDVAEMSAAAAQGMRISNHSYGLLTGWAYDLFGDGRWVWFGDTSVSANEDYRFGFYDDEARTWDSTAYLAPYYLIVKAAGNDRGEGPSGIIQHWVFADTTAVLVTAARQPDGGTYGYDCLNGSAVSKNILTVGAVYDVQGGYRTPDSVFMTSFSSWGPTDDGRIKPDIVANGFLLYSAYGAGDNLYAYASGTSMAAPNAAGSIGLLLQQQRTLHGTTPLRASTLKAIVIGTADECGPSAGPDYRFGWGLMNTLHAAQLMQLDQTEGNGSHIIEGTLLNGDTIRYEIRNDARRQLTATLCWTDPAATSPPVSLNPVTPMLVNDLDLRVRQRTGETLSAPWTLDPSTPALPAARGDNHRDNVEQVMIDSAQRDYYTVLVTHKGSLAGGEQKFSLVIVGNTPTIGPLARVPADSLRVHVLPGGSATDSLRIANAGDIALHVRHSPITAPWLAVDRDSLVITPGDTGTFHYTADASSFAQQSSHAAALTFTTDDPQHATVGAAFLLDVLGPVIAIEPPAVILQTDSGATTSDSLRILNRGFIPLHFSLAPVDTVPFWLSVTGDSGNVPVGDSAIVGFTGTAGALPPADYTARFAVHSNDSLHALLPLTVALRIGTTRDVAITIRRGWNLLALPTFPQRQARATVFPSAISEAFEYSGSYAQRDTLTAGRGYWMRFDAPESILRQGARIVAETIAVVTGWNLIGAVSSPVPVSSLRTIPSGLIESRAYTYNAGYTSGDTILPGIGYWMKVSHDGVLILSADLALTGTAEASQAAPGEMPPPPPGEPEEVPAAIPGTYALANAFPNPFNPTVTIGIQFPTASRVRLVVYDLLGRVVNVLLDGIEGAGYRQIAWNGSGMPSGVYFYRLEAAGLDGAGRSFCQTKRMVLAK